MSTQWLVYGVSHQTSETEMSALFSQYGTVYSLQLTPQSKGEDFLGWGLAEMDKTGAEAVLAAYGDLNNDPSSTLQVSRAGNEHLIQTVSLCTHCRYKDFCAFTLGDEGYEKCGILDHYA